MSTAYQCTPLVEQIEMLAADLSNTSIPCEQRFVSLSAELTILGNGAHEAGLRGVPELLRLVRSGLEQAQISHDALSENELQFLLLWLIQLAAYCSGFLDRAQHAQMIDGLSHVPWIPELTHRMRDFILLRLAESAPGQPDALEPTSASETDAASIEPCDDRCAAMAEQRLPFPEAEPPLGPPAELVPDTVDSIGTSAVTKTEIAIGDDAIWIAAEELALARSAISDQLIPLTQQMFAVTDPMDEVRLFGELEFHTGLIGNAFEVLGLAELRALVAQVQAMLRPETPGIRLPATDLLIAWQVALLAFMEQPNSSSAELVFETANELVGDFDKMALEAELARVRIGIDPKLVAALKRQATPDDVALDLAPDVTPKVLEGMLRELPGNAQRLGESIRKMVDRGSAEDLAEAQRFAHTLKGDANTVGLRGLANITHALEDILVALAQHAKPPESRLLDLLTEAADTVEIAADYVLNRGPRPDGMVSIYQRLLDGANALFLERAGALDVPAGTVDSFSPTEMPAVVEPIGTGPALVPTIEPSQQVAIGLLNELLRLAGESIVVFRQVEQRHKAISEVYRELIGQNRGGRDLVAQLDDLVALRGAALKSARLADSRGVDPLELDQYTELHVVSRRLIESNSDQAAFMQRMDHDLLAFEDLLSTQERTQGELQRLILRTRSVPMSNISGRLQRVTRQVSRQLLKQVELEIEGAGTEIDSELLDRIVEPLSHILRNAIDHGIELPEERVRLNKPEAGRVRLSVSMQGDAVEFVVTDDGRGLDLDAVRRRAEAMGVLAEDAEIRVDDLARLIMLPGFSTKLETTQVSGRGIGMDVVAQRVSDLRGSVSLRSNAGEGLEVTLRLPASLTSANVVLARDGEDTVAAVATSISRIVTLEPGDFEIGPDGRLYAQTEGGALPALPLSALFGSGVRGWSVPELRRIGLIVEAVGKEPHIVYVERVDEVRNVVVKNLGAYLAPIPALRGVTVLGDGGIAPVMDLAQSIEEVGPSGAGQRRNEAPMPTTVPMPRIVVADDSLSVRRALEQLMQDAGFAVDTVRDGVEALDAIRTNSPVAVLLDLEMPRLNGLDVTRYLRHQPDTERMPVIMITSRATDKYRAMAEEAGVTQFMGKPFDEDELVSAVRQCIATAAVARESAESPLVWQCDGAPDT